MKIVFAGTGDARRYVLREAEKGGRFVVCTATPYGAGLYPPHTGIIRVYDYPMDHKEMIRIMLRHRVDGVIDATHPYAVEGSRNIRAAAEALGLSVNRFKRESGLSAKLLGQVVMADSFEDAALDLKNCTGNILLTIGSRHLEPFVGGIETDRLYVRVLATSEALLKCEGLGLTPRQIIAMQGPFSARLNDALYDQYEIEHMVTKDSGAAGGMDQKVIPALDRGIRVVVIKRPQGE